jgi:aspartyl-tRNA(Asn)/glutamyl-tRNA(Gln) amidotransferase subunit B
MRTKEDAADYRYFPDPDLPPLVIAPEWVEKIRSELGQLPREVAERYVREFGLTEYDATMLTQNKATMIYFQSALNSGIAANPKLICNWMIGELSRRLNAEDLPIEQAKVEPHHLATLVNRIQAGTISNNAAKQVFDAMWTWQKVGGAIGSVDDTIDNLGLRQMNDSGALEKIIDEVIAANPDNVAQFKAGKDKAFNALVGQAMKASKGKANPQQVNDLLRRKLGG